MLLLTGCGTTGDAGPQPSPTPELTVYGLPDGVSLPAEVPTDVPNDAAARSGVAIASCEATEDGWRATGTVVDAEGADATYAITIFFTTDAGSVIGFGSTEVETASSEEWEVSAGFTPADPTLCVLRGAAKL